jgi:cytidylate kinase
VFLTASVETRAERRWIQSKKAQPLEVVIEDLKKRDYQDTHRAITPLTQASDAILIDTDDLSFEQNVQQVLDAFYKKRDNA